MSDIFHVQLRSRDGGQPVPDWLPMDVILEGGVPPTGGGTGDGGGTGGGTPAGSDAIDIHNAAVYWSPSDLADWPITRRITMLTMNPEDGFAFGFDRPLPEDWKWPSNPENPAENFQSTVCPVIYRNGRWHTAGIVQMWQGRQSTGRFEWPPEKPFPGRPSFHDYFHDAFCYAARWGEMNLYFPNPGDPFGFFVCAGNGRGTDGVTSVRERSNVVLIERLPATDIGVWNF